MKIYKEYLNKCFEISLSEDIFESDKKLKKYEKLIHETSYFYFLHNIPVAIQCEKALLQYCRPNKKYIIYKFKEYYGISEIVDIWEPEEINPEIQPFDEKQVYPLQEIELKIDWKY